jgi:hypothetical protein
MDYKPLPHDDDRSPVARQHHEIHLYGSKKKILTSILILVVATLAILISVLVLLLLFTLRDSQSCTVREETWSSSARYGQNRSRMSLEHKYDHLWDDFLIEGFGVVSTTEGVADSKDSFAGISMYVNSSLIKHGGFHKKTPVPYRCFRGADWPLTSLTRFHQLHCLSAFRRALQDQRDGKDVGKDATDDPHWPHCFDYLYQVSMVTW